MWIATMNRSQVSFSNIYYCCVFPEIITTIRADILLYLYSYTKQIVLIFNPFSREV